MANDRRLWKLAAGHLGTGIVAALLAPIHLSDPFGLAFILGQPGLRRLPMVPLFALAPCQAVLLALWGTSSRMPPWVRVAGLVAGAVYLETLFRIYEGREARGISTITITVTTAALLLVRSRGVWLAWYTNPPKSASPETEGLRFTIRGLMLSTAIVALLSAVAKTMEASREPNLLQTSIWALCLVAVGMAALWAVLGNARPLRRAPAVLVFSTVLGVFFAAAVGAMPAGWVYIILIMLLYSALLLGSLSVARSCGYRLIRREVY